MPRMGHGAAAADGGTNWSRSRSGEAGQDDGIRVI